MKNIKFHLTQLMMIIIGVGFLSGTFEQRPAEAARFETVPTLQAQHLGNYLGQYLHVMYVNGSRPFLAVEADQINIDQVKTMRTFQITADTINIPQMQIEKEGFRAAYNMIIFVISPSNNFYWLNSNGSLPQGMTPGNSTQKSLVDSLSKVDVDSFISAQGLAATLPIVIGR